MCLRDLLDNLQRLGLRVSESQIRWAISTGKIRRPQLDGSLRFDFDEQHVEQLRDLFDNEQEVDSP